MKKVTGHQAPAPRRARRTRRRPSAPRSASTASTSWRSARTSTPRRAAQGDMIIPVVITVYSDRSFTLHHEDAARVGPAQEGSSACRRRRSRAAGSKEPNKNKVGKITQKQLREIAKLKIQDMNAATRGCHAHHRGHRPLDGHRRRRLRQRTRSARSRTRARPRRSRIAVMPSAEPRSDKRPEQRRKEGQRSKRAALEQGRRDKRYTLDEACALVKKAALREVRRDASTSRCVWASTPSTPIRWCAARSCSRTAPGSRSRSRVRQGREGARGRARPAPTSSARDDLVAKVPGRLHGLRPRDRDAGHDGPGR